MSDSAKLQYTYGIIRLIISIACFICTTISITLSILIEPGIAALALFSFIAGILTIKDSIANFTECGKIQGRNKK